MSGKIIDQLPSLPTEPTMGDEIPVERGTTAYKVGFAELKEAISGEDVKTSDIYNGLDQTAAGKVLDARQGKVLNEGKADMIISSASGAVASFSDGAAYNAVNVVIGIEPVQSGSGDPSPSNVRPISGWTGANVTRTGKNLLPKGASSSLNGLTFTVNDDGSVKVTGTASSLTFLAVQFTIPAGSYILSGCPANGGNSSYLVDVRNSVGGTGISGIGADTGSGSTFTITESLTAYVNIRVASGYAFPADGLLFELMIRKSTDPARFHPYLGTTIPISWQSEAGTVYGGTVKVEKDGTGSLVVTHGQVDLGNLDWKYHTSGNMYADNTPVANRKPGVTQSICSIYTVYPYEVVSVSGLDLNNEYAFQSSLAGRIIIRDTMFTDATAFKTAMSGVQLVYELAEPVTYQLTPQDIALLLGDNNVWADTGDISVQYRADTKLYIDNAIASAIAVL